MTTIVTSSNGFRLRNATLADKDIIIEAYDDFPQPLVQTYQDALDKFSLGHYLNKGYNETTVKDNDAALGRMHVCENAAGAIVGISIDNYNTLAANSCETSWGVVPVAQRGNKYSTAHNMLNNYYIFHVLACDYLYFDLIQTDPKMTAIRASVVSANAAMGNDAATTAEVAKTGVGTGASLKTVKYTAAEFEAYRAGHSTWGSVTYTRS